MENKGSYILRSLPKIEKTDFKKHADEHSLLMPSASSPLFSTIWEDLKEIEKKVNDIFTKELEKCNVDPKDPALIWEEPYWNPAKKSYHVTLNGTLLFIIDVDYLHNKVAVRHSEKGEL